MSFFVVSSGFAASLQDWGRPAIRRFGVPIGGAYDRRSHALANALVGNEPECATLEITLGGPTLRAERSAAIAIVGAEIELRVNGRSRNMQRVIRVDENELLDFGRCLSGMRAYLAVRGGFRGEDFLGSRSTFLAIGVGGIAGRNITPGDRLMFQSDRCDAIRSAVRWYVDPELPRHEETTLRVIRGCDFERLDAASQTRFMNVPFSVSSQQDRMGIRLAGPVLKLVSPFEAKSSAVVPGTIQLPADGRPIVLGVDAGITGGYPQIGYICGADLRKTAQLHPGAMIRFQWIEPDQSAEIGRVEEEMLGKTCEILRDRFHNELA